jgi:ABC-2 type transport system permease protein
MHKALIVASTEFANSVRTKAFLISMLLMPVLMVGVGFGQKFMMERADTREFRFALVDATGVLADAVQRASAEWNAAAVGKDGKPTGARFVVVPQPARALTDDGRVTLSEEVRDDALFAFVEIPADAVQSDSPVRIRYYSSHASYESLPRWLQTTITAAVVSQRFERAAIDRAMVEKLTRPVRIDQLGLVERGPQGGVKPAEEVDPLRTVGVPMILMFLVFIPVMTITPQLVNAVIEEKMSRICEVLLGSVTPFELLLGKLLGAGGVSVVIALTYSAGAYGAAAYFGYADIVSVGLLVEFAVFLALAMLLFGSLYLAVGAACSTLKDAQSLMTPVILLTMIPMMMMGAIIRAPESTFAVAASYFPFSSSYIMLMRAAGNPPAALWEVLLSMAITAVTTVGVVWAAGRIFRTGLLMYGKAPTLMDLVKWVKA